MYVSASQKWADLIVDEGLATASIALLTNRMVLVVPKGKPGRD